MQESNFKNNDKLLNQRILEILKGELFDLLSNPKIELQKIIQKISQIQQKDSFKTLNQVNEVLNRFENFQDFLIARDKLQAISLSDLERLGLAFSLGIPETASGVESLQDILHDRYESLFSLLLDNPEDFCRHLIYIKSQADTDIEDYIINILGQVQDFETGAKIFDNLKKIDGDTVRLLGLQDKIGLLTASYGMVLLNNFPYEPEDEQ